MKKKKKKKRSGRFKSTFEYFLLWTVEKWCLPSPLPSSHTTTRVVFCSRAPLSSRAPTKDTSGRAMEYGLYSEAEEGETLESCLAPRAAQRQDGPGCSPAALRSEVCWARDARSPTGIDDSLGSWEAAGASGRGVRAAGSSSHGRLRGCPGASPLLADTVADAVDQRMVKWLF